MSSMLRRDYSEPNFRAVFDAAPGLLIVLDPSFTIVAVNDANLQATNTKRADVVGRHLFEVFPDNPNNRSAEGLGTMRESLVRVLQTRMPDHLHRLSYAIAAAQQAGGYEDRCWEVMNIPILGEDGFVKWILIAGKDVTELMTHEVGLRDGGAVLHNRKD